MDHRTFNRLSGALDTLLDRTIAPGYTRLGLALRRRLPTWPADPAPDALRGQVALVTGPTSGLGFATAEGLARLGAEVHLVARNPEKGEGVVAQLREAVPGSQVSVRRCDVGDLDDVRRFAAELDLPRLDVVVHNAGVMPPERTESAQGHELSMAVHLLGPVLMTELLSGALAAGRGRVIFVTSGGMYGQKLAAHDPEFRRGDYSPTSAYARSKRAQVDLLPLLDRRWEGVQVCATHPGWADTPGVAESLPGFRKLTGPVLRDAEEGADTTVWLSAVEPAPPSARLWHDRRERPTHLLSRTRSSEADVRRMWAWVLEQIGLTD